VIKTRLDRLIKTLLSEPQGGGKPGMLSTKEKSFSPKRNVELGGKDTPKTRPGQTWVKNNGASGGSGGALTTKSLRREAGRNSRPPSFKAKKGGKPHRHRQHSPGNQHHVLFTSGVWGNSSWIGRGKVNSKSCGTRTRGKGKTTTQERRELKKRMFHTL